MELIRRLVLDREICHYAGPGLLITSRSNKVYVKRGDQETTVSLPNSGLKEMLGFNRLARRLTRLDKCNVVPVVGGLVIIRQGRVYHYDEKTPGLALCVTATGTRSCG